MYLWSYEKILLKTTRKDKDNKLYVFIYYTLNLLHSSIHLHNTNSIPSLKYLHKFIDFLFTRNILIIGISKTKE